MTDQEITENEKMGLLRFSFCSLPDSLTFSSNQEDWDKWWNWRKENALKDAHRPVQCDYQCPDPAPEELLKAISEAAEKHGITFRVNGGMCQAEGTKISHVRFRMATGLPKNDDGIAETTIRPVRDEEAQDAQ